MAYAVPIFVNKAIMKNCPGIHSFCLAVLGLLMLSAIASAEEIKAADDRPNIVFIFSDDHATHAIGAYNGWLKEVNPTPNIDALARQGMLFQNSFCTNSICGPSRAVILTGKFSHLNGFMNNGNNFDGDQQTFPKLLQKAGYQTAMIGKWHLNSMPQGFDYWDILPGQGDYYNPVLINKDGRRQVEGYCTDIVTELALDWLKDNKDNGKPFVLMCQHKAPHRNWMPPERHLTLYDDIEIPVPPTLFDQYEDNAEAVRRFQEMEIDRHMGMVSDLFGPRANADEENGQSFDRSGTRNLQAMTPAQLANWEKAYGPKNEAFLKAKLTGRDLVKWKYQRYIKNYLRCVRGVDDSVGQIRAFLKEHGLDQNTIVIYCSDQGFYLGDHGWYDKRYMYEESLKMPFIIQWPGVTTPGQVNSNLIQNIDYAPTFLEMASADIPDDMQGRSLVPLLKGEKVDDWRTSIYYHYYEFPSVHMAARHYGIRTERFKLIHFYQFDQWEFYDLQSDPDELKNDYENPAYQDKIAELKAKLSELRMKYKDDSDVSVQPQAWKEQMLERVKRNRERIK
jgi:arylsulfatase A-like enzyme